LIRVLFRSIRFAVALVRRIVARAVVTRHLTTRSVPGTLIHLILEGIRVTYPSLDTITLHPPLTHTRSFTRNITVAILFVTTLISILHRFDDACIVARFPFVLLSVGKILLRLAEILINISHLDRKSTRLNSIH